MPILNRTHEKKQPGVELIRGHENRNPISLNMQQKQSYTDTQDHRDSKATYFLSTHKGCTKKTLQFN